MLNRWIHLISAVVIVLASAAGAAERLPIFDTHLHYNRAAWDGLSPGGVKKLLDDAGVTRALVSSSPDEGTRRLRAENAETFVSELRPYRDRVNSTNWLDDPKTLAFLEARLKQGGYVGIGEVHLYGVDDGRPGGLARIAVLAARLGVFMHVHASAEPIRRLFQLAPDLKVLWAHAGMSEPPDVVGPMLDQYPALNAELSFRAEDITDEKGDMDPAWRALLIRHADRFTIGSDTYENSRWADYGGLIEAHRYWLAMLPDDVQRRIAFDNAARILARR